MTALILSALLGQLVVQGQGPVTRVSCGAGVTCTRTGSTWALSTDGGAGGGTTIAHACPAGQYVSAIDGGAVTCSTPDAGSGTTGLADPFRYAHPIDGAMRTGYFLQHRKTCGSTAYSTCGVNIAGQGAGDWAYATSTGGTVCAWYALTFANGNPVAFGCNTPFSFGAFAAHMNIQPVSGDDAGVRYRVWVGAQANQTTMNGDTYAEDHAAGFRLSSTAGDTAWMCCQKGGAGTETCTSSGATVSLANTSLKIARVGNAINYYINGAQVCSISNPLPTGNGYINASLDSSPTAARYLVVLGTAID